MGKTLEILEGAKKNVERGWTQQMFEAGDGAVCIIGAVRKATAQTLNPNATSEDFDLVDNDAMKAMQQATCILQNVLGVDGEHNIYRWNDAGDRKKKDVIKTLDKAIAIVKEAEAENA